MSFRRHLYQSILSVSDTFPEICSFKVKPAPHLLQTPTMMITLSTSSKHIRTSTLTTRLLAPKVSKPQKSVNGHILLRV